MPPRFHVRLLLRLLLLHVIVTVSATTASAYNRSSNCTLLPDVDIVREAFRNVTNFRLPPRPTCRLVRRLRSPSSNLTGAVGWAALGNLSSLLTVDLSGNSLQGDVHGAFWRAPSLRAVDVSGNRLGGALQFEPSTSLASLNVSGNRFTSVEGMDRLAGLEDLDVSRNRISAVPEGLRMLTRVRRLDLSQNSMAGRFPDDFPQLDGVEFLNISYNNFSGVVNCTLVTKFGHFAFFQAGNTSLVIEDIPPAPSPPARGGKKHKRAVLIVVVVVCAVVTVAALVFLAGCVACGLKRRRKNVRH